ncbi:ANTAR domain-containing protein [Nakamurella silvestris]|nr:ANTAR domain-containing protein [Nakamurella silvestris]
MTAGTGPVNAADHDLPEAIRELAETLLTDGAVLLDEIVRGAVHGVPGVAGAVIAEHTPDDRLIQLAAYGQVPTGFIPSQDTLGHGPTLDAANDPIEILIAEHGADQRWPDFTALTMTGDVKSTMSAPLALGGKALGALTFLAADATPFDNDAQDTALIFAAHAATVIAAAHRESGLTQSRDSRDLIGRAKGILIERFNITDLVAFALLVRTSSQTNTKLTTIARHLCDTGQLPTSRPPQQTTGP